MSRVHISFLVDPVQLLVLTVQLSTHFLSNPLEVAQNITHCPAHTHTIIRLGRLGTNKPCVYSI